MSVVFSLSEYTFALPWSKMPSKYSSQQCTYTLPKSQAPSHYTSLQLTFTLTSAQTPLRCTSLQITFALPLSPVCQHIPSHRHDQKCPQNAPHSNTLAHCLYHTKNTFALHLTTTYLRAGFTTSTFTLHLTTTYLHIDFSTNCKSYRSQANVY